jgi:hypothetical protein
MERKTAPTATETPSSRVAVIAITAALYALGKALTGFISTPWNVGEVLIAAFLPVFMVVVAETLPVAVGTGIGTFIGDYFVRTTPILSLVAGVPANFIAILLLGWFVKRYRSWSSFVAGTVAFLTLGNLIAAVNVVLFLNLPTGLILGLVLYWNTTGIPAIIVAVPLLVRAVRPLFGRSKILTDPPEWTAIVGKRQITVALLFATFYVLIGVVIFLTSSASVEALSNNGLSLIGYFAVAALVVFIFGPLSGVVAGAKVGAKHAST